MQTRSREEQLLAYFQEHFDDEVAGDVEKTLAGCTDDIVYEHPFRLGVMQGIDEVRKYYTETWAERPFEKIEVLRHWVHGDDTIFVEIDTTFGAPNAHRVRTLCVGIFRDGKLAKEIVYTGPAID
jgi:hypothetical protein